MTPEQFRDRMANPAAEMARIAKQLRTDGLIVRHLHPLVAKPNPGGVWLHELHAERAEARMAREGIKPELTAYLAGIGKTYGG